MRSAPLASAHPPLPHTTTDEKKRKRTLFGFGREKKEKAQVEQEAQEAREKAVREKERKKTQEEEQKRVEQQEESKRLQQKRERQQELLKKNLDPSTRVFQLNMKAPASLPPQPRQRVPHRLNGRQ